MGILSDEEVEHRREAKRQLIDKYAAEQRVFGYGSSLAIDCGDWIHLRAQVKELEAALRRCLDGDGAFNLHDYTTCEEDGTVNAARGCPACTARRALAAPAAPCGDPECNDGCEKCRAAPAAPKAPERGAGIEECPRNAWCALPKAHRGACLSAREVRDDGEPNREAGGCEHRNRHTTQDDMLTCSDCGAVYVGWSK